MKLSHMDMHDDPISVGTCMYKMGIELHHLGEVCGSFRCFSDAFLARGRNNDLEGDPMWSEFHQIQMSLYLSGKPDRCISSLAEGDMIHDLIAQRYRQLLGDLNISEIPFAGSDKHLWFRTIKIDFPWDVEIETVGDSSSDYADWDHFGHEFSDFSQECVKITQ